MQVDKIEKMYAFIAYDNVGGEGIMGINLGGSWLPLVGADLARVKSLYPIAKQIKEVSGKNFRVCTFDNRKDVTESVEQDCNGA